MNNKLFPMAGTTALLLGAALLITLTACEVDVRGPRPEYVYAAPPPPQPVFVGSDDYVYYPQYGLYFGSRSHLYFYQEGSAWVSRPAPRSVSVGVLLASPSVRVDFHDSPAAHHAQIARTYPKNWKPAGEDHPRNEGQRENEKR